VLGLASEEESKEFEKLCTLHPELAEARSAFELSLEQHAFANAINPDPDTKIRILNKIGFQDNFIPQASVPVRKINGWKYAAAACVALLAGSIYFNISISKENKKLKTELEVTQTAYTDIQKDIEMLRKRPDVKMASLKGTESSPSSYTTVYWDTVSHDVYLLVNNLPVPADSMQYQLWALADGQPVDLGFISEDYIIRQDKLLLKVKNTSKAQAFAITLEKKGRADISKPEGKMYVLGNL
jgi:anti-sigma-K factor RskA